MRVIRENSQRYPISAMCKILKISRKTYYTYRERTVAPDPYEDLVVDIFGRSRKIYGCRKIKAELEKLGYLLSRRRICRIMRENGLESVYHTKKYRGCRAKVNEGIVANIVDRRFDGRKEHEVIVSDLTYVRVGGSWGYVCLLLDLFNRELVGWSCGEHKDAGLVSRAFARVSADLRTVSVFHTDRGCEFDNHAIDDTLKAFGITRSLSRKGCPYDNAVAESTFKIIKKEFVRARSFRDMKELEREMTEYVHWFNTERLHSSLGYRSPAEYKEFVRQNIV